MIQMHGMELRRQYENLANAIVIQAVKDYRSAGRNRYIKTDVISFIRSAWFGILTDVNPMVLEQKLKSMVSEEGGR